MILQQNAVSSYINATRKQIEDYLSNIGFQKSSKNDYTWENEYFTISDVEPDNVLVDSKAGELKFIDPLIGFEKPAKYILDEILGNDAIIYG